MRIIKKGKDPEAERTTTCYNCKTKFAYEKKDVVEDVEEERVVPCPVCKKKIPSEL